MTKTELVLKALEDMGYKPEVDEDGDISFYYQMKNIMVIIGEEEEPYLAFLLPQFNEVDEGEETLSLFVCNKVTRQLKLAKVYIDPTLKNVTASCEFYYTDEESLRQNIEHSLYILSIVRSIYRDVKLELKD